MNQCFVKKQASTEGWPSWVGQSRQRGCCFLQKPHCHMSLPTRSAQCRQSFPEQWPHSARTYPSASSIGSGGGSREADGRTVLVPRETRSCSVFVDREATAMG